MPPVLAAMAEKYPPDWSQSVTIPSDSGITHVTTLLGPGQPATTHSHDTLAAVRTISVDVNQHDEVVGARLLEFVSPDALDPNDFADYVEQWEDRDFGDLRMLISEYDIGYDAKICEVYTPDEGFKPVELTLAEGSGMGKTQVTTWCWITDIVEGWVCVGPLNGTEAEECVLDSVDVYITCVELGVPGGGGGGGGDDDGDGEEEEEDEDDEEEACPDTCTQEQCDLAEEYANDPNWDASDWPCDEFFSINSQFLAGTTGAENFKHSPYGYVDPTLSFGYDEFTVAFEDYQPFTISSGYRCPIGNGNLPGSQPVTRHVRGFAVDVTGHTADGGLWPTGTDVPEKLGIKYWTESIDEHFEFMSYNSSTHVHLGWPW